MSTIDNIGRSIQRIAALGLPKYGHAFEGICVAVDKDSATMSVKFHEGSEIFEGVRLQLYGGGGQLVYYPKADSHVVLLCLNGDQNNLFCVGADEYEDVAMKVSGKYTIKSGEADLKDIFAKTIKALRNLVVLTSQGQSVGLSPKSLQDIKDVEDELAKFYE